jgi:ubiquinone/menaquinone biosynthesis C-methylase UbiE
MKGLHYFTDNEYERVFFEFGNFRGNIAERMHQLSPIPESIVLDFMSGHGLLSAEIAQRFPEAKVIGTGLNNDVESWRQVSQSRKYISELWSKFHYLLCDATRIPVKSSTCDMVVNFLGLEDLHMTHGRMGVRAAITEIDRITKDNALIEVSLAEYGDLPEERVAKEVWDTIGLNAVFLQKEDYLEMLEDSGISLLDECVLNLGMKMTSAQAREELRFACEEAPKIFAEFGVRARDFDDLWTEFGPRIAEHGMAYWSQIRVLILSKGNR